MKIHVLRLGHRIERDKRVTTHCCLVARAFGAEKIVFSGEKDEKILSGIEKVAKEWGGKFEIEYREDWRRVLKEYKKNGFKIMHMTMFGKDIDEDKGKIKDKKILIVIGAEKVPIEVYHMADYNIAVLNQPHSEVAALAIVLDRLIGKDKIKKRFSGAKRKINPGQKGSRNK